MTEPSERRSWHLLSLAEQTRLLDEFGRYQDGLPLTCSLELKTERFRDWLRSRGIDYGDRR